MSPSSSQSDEKGVAINTVLPTEQTTAQAKAQMERDHIIKKKVENAFQTLSGRHTDNKKREVRDYSPAKSKRRKIQNDKGKVPRKVKNDKTKLLKRDKYADIFEIQ